MKRMYKYKVKRGFLRNEERMLKAGFSIAYVDDYAEDKVYAIPVKLDLDKSIWNLLVEEVNEWAKKEEIVKEHFIEEGYKFDEEGKIVLDEKFVSENSQIELCVFLKEGVLYANAGGFLEFIDCDTLDNEFPEIIKNLADLGLIYKKRISKRELM